MLRQEKRQYYNAEIETNKHDSSETRKTIKKLVRGKNCIKNTEIYFERKIERDENKLQKSSTTTSSRAL